MMKKILIKKRIAVICLLFTSITSFSQVEDFKKRLDEEKKGGVIPQTEKILLDYDSIFNKDSVLVYPIYLFDQDISNIDKEKYLNYSFLDDLKWRLKVPEHSLYPFELIITDLHGDLKCLFMHAKSLKLHSGYAEYSDSNGDEVLKKLLVKLLHNGVFDYAFVTSFPVIEEKSKKVFQQVREGFCFCIKNNQVYVLFQDRQLYTIEDFVKQHWELFDVKTNDTYSD